MPSKSRGGAGARVVDKNDGGGGGEGDMDDAGRVDASEASFATLSSEKEAVLLDVRNVYETSIGHFRCGRIVTIRFQLSPRSTFTTNAFRKRSLCCSDKL